MKWIISKKVVYFRAVCKTKNRRIRDDASRTRDWAELNSDILRLISKKLGDISNVVRFRTVCKNWRLAIARPCDHPPQIPWFAMYDPMSMGPFDLEFFSLYCNTIHTFHIPRVTTLGPSNRHLLMCDQASLLNPITGSRFPIPKVENYTPLYPIYIGPNPNQNENDDIAIAYMNNKKPKLLYVAFYGFDDQQVTKIIEVPYAIAIIYFQGRLFVSARETKETKVFDVTGGDEVLVISHPGIVFGYFIEDCGDLFGVVRSNGVPSGECQFQVYQLVDSGINSRWVKTTDGIGDRMLFLDNKGGLCLKADDFDGFRGNCIYFTRCSCSFLNDYKYTLCRYDLESKETQELTQCREFFYGMWHVPSLY